MFPKFKDNFLCPQADFLRAVAVQDIPSPLAEAGTIKTDASLELKTASYYTDEVIPHTAKALAIL